METFPRPALVSVGHMSKRHKEKKRSNRDIQEVYRQRQRLDAKAVDLCPHGTPWDKPCEECFRVKATKS